MFSSHTHHTLYNLRFISPDIHLYFIRSPWGPGGCNSSPRDTGLRGRRPSGPGRPSDRLSGPGLGGPGRPRPSGPGGPGLRHHGPDGLGLGLGGPGLGRTRRSGVPSLRTCNTLVTRLPALKTLYIP
ncbi:hypothetical protein CgunFtcFv8_021008 [Champsocephalus gunnari]|uniref:Uncharacterized protein n=1 Tax=Champsocephalus gunnari TaxID=52237 RepID=A0AAN8E5Q1_CHAGU|nr:hypothetical protein CgunFtcFv8_021008 [Champsocephalus gunnari]